MEKPFFLSARFTNTNVVVKTHTHTLSLSTHTHTPHKRFSLMCVMESIVIFFLPPNMADAESRVNWISVGLWGSLLIAFPFFFSPEQTACVSTNRIQFIKQERKKKKNYFRYKTPTQQQQQWNNEAYLFKWARVKVICCLQQLCNNCA